MKKIERRRVGVGLTLALGVVLTVWATVERSGDDEPPAIPQASASEPRSGDSTSSELTGTSARWARILLTTPRRGATFDRAFEFFDKTGKIDSLLAFLERRIADDSGSVAALTVRGLVFERLGDVSRALDDWAAACERDPNAARAWAYRGTLLAERGDLSEGVDAFEAALARASTGKLTSEEIADAARRLAAVCEKLGDSSRAADAFRRWSAALEPDDLAGRLDLFDAAIRGNDFDAAARESTLLNELAPNDFDVGVRRGELASLDERNPESERRANAARIWTELAESPEVVRNASRLRRLAESFARIGDVERAETLYRRSFEAAPSSFEAAEALSRFYAESGRAGDVAETLGAAARAVGESAASLRRIGEAALNLDATDVGLDALTSAARRELGDEPERIASRLNDFATDAEARGDRRAARAIRERIDETASSDENARRLWTLLEPDPSVDEARKGAFYRAKIWPGETFCERLATSDRRFAAGETELAREIAESTAFAADGETDAWRAWYRSGELAARTGRVDEAAKAFAAMEKSFGENALSDVEASNETERAESQDAVRAAESFKIETKNDGAVPLARLCSERTLPEAKVVVATLFADRATPARSTESAPPKPRFQPANRADAALLARLWSAKAEIDSTTEVANESDEARNAVATRVGAELRSAFDVGAILRESKSSAELFDRAKRRAILDDVCEIWARIDGLDGLRPNELEIAQIDLALGFVAPFDDSDFASCRNDNYRTIMRELARDAVLAFLNETDLDATAERVFNPPRPEFSRAELAKPFEEAKGNARTAESNATDGAENVSAFANAPGIPSTLAEKTTWALAFWTAEAETVPNPATIAARRRGLSNEIYSQNGGTMNLIAPVWSRDVRVGDFYLLRDALSKAGRDSDVRTLNADVEKISATSADWTFDAAFAATDSGSLLIDSTDDPFLRFNPILIFPERFESLGESFRWLDRLETVLAADPNAPKRLAATLNALFLKYLTLASRDVAEASATTLDRNFQLELRRKRPSDAFASWTPPTRTFSAADLRKLNAAADQIDFLVGEFLRRIEKLSPVDETVARRSRAAESPIFLRAVDELFRRFDATLDAAAFAPDVDPEDAAKRRRTAFRSKIAESSRFGSVFNERRSR